MSSKNKPMIRIHNVETNEIIDREMNDVEYAEWQTQQEAKAKTEINEIAKLKAKSDLLVKLGIDEEEAKLLLA